MSNSEIKLFFIFFKYIKWLPLLILSLYLRVIAINYIRFVLIKKKAVGLTHAPLFYLKRVPLTNSPMISRLLQHFTSATYHFSLQKNRFMNSSANVGRSNVSLWVLIVIKRRLVDSVLSSKIHISPAE